LAPAVPEAEKRRPRSDLFSARGPAWNRKGRGRFPIRPRPSVVEVVCFSAPRADRSN